MTIHIYKMKVTEFGPLKNVEVGLTPLHAFIGPNDSGKSSLLNAVDCVICYAGNRGLETTRHEHLLHPWEGMSIRISVVDPGSTVPIPDYVLGARGSSFMEMLVSEQGESLGSCYTSFGESPKGLWRSRNPGDTPEKYIEEERLQNLTRKGVLLINWDIAALKEAGQLIASDRLVEFVSSRGRGLPSIYDAINNLADGTFQTIVEKVKRRFDTIEHVRLKNVGANLKEIEVKLKTGEVVPARQMSEGFLYYLGFLAVQHVAPPAVLLVEEPENGLHPARIRDVVSILRELSATMQVLVATHSPLVVNELQPAEVSVVTRDSVNGTRVTPIMRTPNFEERSKVYALGELWLSYADGVTEGPLLDEKEP